MLLKMCDLCVDIDLFLSDLQSAPIFLLMGRSTACSLTVVIRNLLIYPGGLQGLHEGGETSLRIRLRAKKHFFLLVRPERKGDWKCGEG